MSKIPMMNLRGKIIRYSADTLWGFRAAEVIEDDEPQPEIVVRHFDMTTERVLRIRVTGYMDQGKFVPTPLVRQMNHEQAEMTRRLAEILRRDDT